MNSIQLVSYLRCGTKLESSAFIEAEPHFLEKESSLSSSKKKYLEQELHTKFPSRSLGKR